MIHLKRGMRHHDDEKRDGKMQTTMNSNRNSSTQRFPILVGLTVVDCFVRLL
jgi:hypothetical protein